MSGGYSYPLAAIRGHNFGGGNGEVAPGTITFASLGTTSYTVNWPAVSGADSYILQRKLTSQSVGSFANIATPVSNTASSTGMSANGSYDYRVAEVVGGVTGPWSAIATQDTLPTAPTSPSATSISTSQINIAWTSPGGTETLTYLVEYSANGTTGWTTLITIGTTSTSDTSLSQGQTRYYRISAINAGGQGAASSVVNATTKNPPGKPINVKGTPGHTHISVAFDPPATGGTPTSYTASATPHAGGSAITNTGASSPIDVTGLTDGIGYDLTVTATNADGTGPPSDLTGSDNTNVVPLLTAPGAPTGLTVTSHTSYSIGLSWTAPANNGGAAITDYDPQYSLDGGSTWASYGHPAGTGTSITMGGLTPGQNYTFQVAAINSVGTGAYSSTVTQSADAGWNPNSITSATTSVWLDWVNSRSFANQADWTHSSAVRGNGQTVGTIENLATGFNGVTDFGSDSTPAVTLDTTNGWYFNNLGYFASNGTGTGHLPPLNTSGQDYEVWVVYELGDYTAGAQGLYGPSIPSGQGPMYYSNAWLDDEGDGVRVNAAAFVGNTTDYVVQRFQFNATTKTWWLNKVTDPITSYASHATGTPSNQTSQFTFGFNDLSKWLKHIKYFVVTRGNLSSGDADKHYDYLASRGMAGSKYAAPVLTNNTYLTDTQLSVAFSVPYPGTVTVISNPGGITASGTTSPIIVNGLTPGQAYTFTGYNVNSYATSPISAASNSVTPVNFTDANSVTSATLSVWLDYQQSQMSQTAHDWTYAGTAPGNGDPVGTIKNLATGFGGNTGNDYGSVSGTRPTLNTTSGWLFSGTNQFADHKSQSGSVPVLNVSGQDYEEWIVYERGDPTAGSYGLSQVGTAALGCMYYGSQWIMDEGDGQRSAVTPIAGNTTDYIIQRMQWNSSTRKVWLNKVGYPETLYTTHTSSTPANQTQGSQLANSSFGSNWNWHIKAYFVFRGNLSSSDNAGMRAWLASRGMA